LTLILQGHQAPRGEIIQRNENENENKDNSRKVVKCFAMFLSVELKRTFETRSEWAIQEASKSVSTTNRLASGVSMITNSISNTKNKVNGENIIDMPYEESSSQTYKPRARGMKDYTFLVEYLDGLKYPRPAKNANSESYVSRNNFNQHIKAMDVDQEDQEDQEPWPWQWCWDVDNSNYKETEYGKTESTHPYYPDQYLGGNEDACDWNHTEQDAWFYWQNEQPVYMPAYPTYPSWVLPAEEVASEWFAESWDCYVNNPNDHYMWYESSYPAISREIQTESSSVDQPSTLVHDCGDSMIEEGAVASGHSWDCNFFTDSTSHDQDCDNQGADWDQDIVYDNYYGGSDYQTSRVYEDIQSKRGKYQSSLDPIQEMIEVEDRGAEEASVASALCNSQYPPPSELKGDDDLPISIDTISEHDISDDTNNTSSSSKSDDWLFNNFDDENVEVNNDDSFLYMLTSETENELINSVIQWENEQEVPRPSQMASAYSIHQEKRKRKRKEFDLTLDSASDTHVLSMEAASLLFSTKPSDLKIIGVSGARSTADVEGQLVITVLHGDKQYQVDLGTGYGLSGCPLNILSVSKLLDDNAVVHFEKGNCYLKLTPTSTQIPIIENDGLFKIRGGEASAPPQAEDTTHDDFSTINNKPNHSFTVNGKAFAVSADLNTWHRRVRHMNKKKLLEIHTKGLVTGFKLKGAHNSKCDCETCKLAKIQRIPVHHSREYESEASSIGHTISTDVKSVGVETHKGFKYVVVFVDHYSNLALEYFMRSKGETTKMLKRFINDMWRLGKVKIKNIQSDRGSEYFEQEGEAQYNWERRQHDFEKCCSANHITHIKRPVEGKEKVAEQWFKEHFRCADSMLLEARMSPIFWADAVKYSNFQFNRTPNLKRDDLKSPWELLTGQRVRWDKWKVFGADVYEHIPNNKFNKVPGIPKGRKEIFLGFTEGMEGHLVFNLVKRTTHTAGNCYFNEDFTSRQNALYFYDKRRELQQKGEHQPLIIDDFDCSPQESDARKLFLSNDNDLNILNQRTEVNRNQGIRNSSPNSIIGKAANEAHLEEQDVMIRPIRLLPIHKKAKFSEKDKNFLRAMEVSNAPIVYLMPCPKKGNTPSRIRYEKYMFAKTIKEAFELGATSGDLRWDYCKGYIQFPKNESTSKAHVFNATRLLDQHGVVHHSERPSFNNTLATVYEPELILKMIEDRQEMVRLADLNASKVMNSSSVKIDFSLDPEPITYEMAIKSSESESWKLSMQEEMASMVKFGVYTRVPRKIAKGRQILGCKWVYKRKTDKNGIVYRYRSRLVAQGFRQRAYDSYNPDETYSPVVHKDTLRLFLSVSAAQNMKIFQADVKAAFLQAPLKEKIYMKCPPGFESYDESGEEEVLELNSAVYGLVQASACFWTALNDHLVKHGFKPTLGDPCLLKGVMENGKPILVCCYVDDVTYSTPDDETAELFLKTLRDRFVIDEGEGKPIEWLLGMRIDQNLEKGTVHMSMETMITKLAHGILTPQEVEKSRNVHTPMLVTPLLKQETRDVPQSKFDYLSIVGSLLHITNCVRCDIAYAVGALTRHSLTVGDAHVKAVKRVVMYLLNTKQLGITYFRDVQHANVPTLYEGAVHPLNNGKNLLQTFVDSDYAMHQTRRSTIGKVLILNGGPISWGSVLGKTVATSTCEAEVNGAVSAVKDAIHIKRLMMDLDLMEDVPLQIAEDNSACIAQAESGLRHVRNAKHYEVKLRFLQQHVVDKTVEFVYCSTENQYADLFTKPLDELKFRYFRDKLMIQVDEN
jgi:hypothetical protein